MFGHCPFLTEFFKRPRHPHLTPRFCRQYKTHWAGPCVGIAIAAFGLQIVSTTTFAYLTDCYKPQSAEISTVLNFGRLTFSFTLGFYMVRCHNGFVPR